jgi:hypothetical protein
MNKLSDTVERKFIDTIDLTDWEIETEDGWKDITQLHTTIPYEVYEVILENGMSLRCADTHILMTAENEEVFAIDCIGKLIKTSSGPSKAISCAFLGFSENMYDFTVDSDEHTYYTNGILSHNTQVSIIFLIHYVLFQQDKTVAILANNERTASDILRKLKDSYESLPLWLQQGVVEGGWSKTTIQLENKCLIISGSTSSNGIRGRTINCVVGDTVITVRDTETNEISDIPMSFLEELLTE